MITDNLARGGKERRLLELLKGLVKRSDIEVELVLFSKQVEYEVFYELDMKTHFLERKPKKDPRVFYKFFQVCKQFKPDIIHSWGHMPSVYAMPSVWFSDVKFINAMITDAPNQVKWYEDRGIRSMLTFPFSDVIMANSYAGLRVYKVAEEKAWCIHNGLDFNRLNDLDTLTAVKERLGIQTPFVVGMVGAFEYRKDYTTYIQAGLEILKQRDDVSFLAIGGGKDLPAMKKLVPESFQDRFIFTGKLKGVESVVNAFDIGVLTSNVAMHGEGISNAILEYMALGKPVVATDCGGTSEILLDKETGFLVGDKDVGGIIHALQRLLNEPSLAASMGQKGKDRVWKHFNLALMVDKYMELYRKLVGQRETVIS